MNRTFKPFHGQGQSFLGRSCTPGLASWCSGTCARGCRAREPHTPTRKYPSWSHMATNESRVKDELCCFIVTNLALEHFGAHVVRGAHCGLRFDVFVDDYT